MAGLAAHAELDARRTTDGKRMQKAKQKLGTSRVCSRDDVTDEPDHAV